MWVKLYSWLELSKLHSYWSLVYTATLQSEKPPVGSRLDSLVEKFSSISSWRITGVTVILSKQSAALAKVLLHCYPACELQKYPSLVMASDRILVYMINPTLAHIYLRLKCATGSVLCHWLLPLQWSTGSNCCAPDSYCAIWDEEQFHLKQHLKKTMQDLEGGTGGTLTLSCLIWGFCSRSHKCFYESLRTLQLNIRRTESDKIKKLNWPDQTTRQ